VVVISDSVALIGLSSIGALDLLRQLYGTVIIPTAVYQEIVIAGAGKPGSQAIATANWIQQRAVRRKRFADRLQKLVGLGQGESEAIALAQEIKADLILLDDAKARRYALQQQLSFTGLVGVLLAAKQLGLFPFVRPYLNALIAAGIFIDPTLYRHALNLAGE
jgi:predicted nucleic acid-binding protein